MRTFAILNINNGVDLIENIIKWLPVEDKVVVFMSENEKNTKNLEFQEKTASLRRKNAVEVRFFPEEFRFYGSKLKNFVSRQFLDEKTSGFLHVIEDSVQIFNKPDVFLGKIEEMMAVFKLKSWFETSCDQCNYVYSKFNPRTIVVVDEEEATKRYPATIMWCSNANTLWVCYNMDKCQFEDMRFEERFRWSMYYIIEFLARRRNTKKPGQLDYMNYYPTVQEEQNVFKCLDIPDGYKLSENEMKAEGDIFKNELKVDNHSDISVEAIIEDMMGAIMDYDPPPEKELLV